MAKPSAVVAMVEALHKELARQIGHDTVQTRRDDRFFVLSWEGVEEEIDVFELAVEALMAIDVKVLV